MRLAKYLVARRRRLAPRGRADHPCGAGHGRGVTITDPARNVELGDAVARGRQPVAPAPEPVVYAVNKPAGVVSTARDPQGRPTVASLVPEPARGSTRSGAWTSTPRA